jgi:hypothetical protein
MSSLLTSAWLGLSRSQSRAAHQLRADENWASAVNRSYFAAFSAANAIALLCGAQLPTNTHGWPHKSLPALLFSLLHSRMRAASRAYYYRDALVVCRNYRVIADYRPLNHLGARSATETLRLSGSVCRLAEELYRDQHP